jgi:hypothetical protein
MKALGVLRQSAAPYLFLVVAAVVLGKYVSYLREYVWPAIPLIKSHAPIIYVSAAGIGIAAVLWLFYRGHRTHSRTLQWLLGLLIATWAVHLAIAISHDDLFPISAFLYVPVLVGLWMKTPSEGELLAALKFMAWLVAGILVVTRLLELLGWIPMVDVGASLVQFEQEHYWLPMSGWLGPEGRWPGPGGHNAMTGNSGAMLLVLAVALRGRAKYVLGFIGVLTLLLTSSRNSFIAAFVGVALVVAFGDNWVTQRLGRKQVASILAALLLLAASYVLLLNRNLTGRTTYWNLFIDLWQQSPWVGVGSTGVAAGDPTISGTNGHNLIIDSLVRYGVVGAVAVAAILVLAVVIVIGAARYRFVLPLGVVGAFCTIGLVESDINWLGFSELILWFVLAVALAAQASPRLESLAQTAKARVGAQT